MHNLVPRDSLLSQLPKSTDTPLSGFCAKFGIRDTCPWFKNKCQTKQKKMNFRRLSTKQSDVTVWQDAHFLLSSGGRCTNPPEVDSFPEGHLPSF